MADVKSYAWAHQLTAPVAKDETVEVATPGFENPDNYDTSKTEIVYVSTVLRWEQVHVSWDMNHSKVTLKNLAEAPWEFGNSLYVTVPGVPFDADNVEASFTTLQAQVADHETRITALESVTGAAAKATIAAKVEQAKTAAPAQRPGPVPQRPPQAPPRAPVKR